MLAIVTRRGTVLKCKAVMVAIGLVFVLFAGGFAAEKVEIRFSGYYPESYPVYKEGIRPWEEMVQKESSGKVVFANYLNGVLNAAKHGFRATKEGICDITTGYPLNQPASFSLSFLGDLPFAVSKSYSGVLAMETLYPKYFKKEYERMGPYLAFWVCTSPYNLMSRRPIHSLEDLKGLKVRAVGGICSDMLHALGAVPVILQSSESYTSLQSGVVDAVIYPDSSSVSYRIYEIAKYHVKIGFYHASVPYALSPKFFNGLNPENKTYVYNKLRQAAQMASHSYDIEDLKAEKVFKENGVEMIELPESEMARFRKAVESLWEKFIADNEAKGLPARQLVADFRKLEKEYSQLTPEQAFDMVTKNPVQGIITF